MPTRASGNLRYFQTQLRQFGRPRSATARRREVDPPGGFRVIRIKLDDRVQSDALNTDNEEAKASRASVIASSRTRAVSRDPSRDLKDYSVDYGFRGGVDGATDSRSAIATPSIFAKRANFPFSVSESRWSSKPPPPTRSR